jgi:hypothetical protein
LLEPAPRLPESGPRGPIPRRLARLVTRMMAKRPEERPDRMEDVVAELDAALVPSRPRLGPVVASLGALALLSAAGAVWVARHRPGAPVAEAAVAARPTSVPAAAPAEPAVEVAPRPTPPPAEPVVQRVAVQVTSQPPGALVTVDGHRVGVTPVRVSLPEESSARLVLHLSGYARATRVVRPRPGLTVAVPLQPAPRPGLPDLKDSPY